MSKPPVNGERVAVAGLSAEADRALENPVEG